VPNSTPTMVPVKPAFLIRGCPIFSVSGVDDDGGVRINCAKLTNSQRLFPYCQMQ
jgi:hypothetical protein